jgi:hypothetical protein
MSLISKETLLTHLQRAEMASEVQLPIDFFRDLLYQAMPREWIGLTDDEMLMIYGQQHEGKKYSLGRMIEAKLKQKNGFAEEKNT